MINIPPEIRIKNTIKAGSVYYFKKTSFTSNKPHYFIVINNNPLTDRALLLVCISSQIETTQQRRRFAKDTLVMIKKNEYEALAVDSIVDCNMVFGDYTIDRVISKFKRNELEIKPNISEHIVDKLREAAEYSPMVEGWKKDLLSDF